jgi:hypothetical protein
MPYSWNSTAQPRMCNCPKPISLAWECTRCGKINAPWKGSCDCTPTPFGAPTSAIKVDKFLVAEIGQWKHYDTGDANPFLGYFPDTNNSDSLNKNFTDK